MVTGSMYNISSYGMSIVQFAVGDITAADWLDISRVT